MLPGHEPMTSGRSTSKTPEEHGTDGNTAPEILKNHKGVSVKVSSGTATGQRPLPAPGLNNQASARCRSDIQKLHVLSRAGQGSAVLSGCCPPPTVRGHSLSAAKCTFEGT